VELKTDQPSVWVIGGAAAAVLGSLLPWATVSAGLFSRTVNGTGGDGTATLVAGIILGVIGWSLRQMPPGRGALIATALISLAVLCVGVYDYHDVQQVHGANISVSIGIGLYLVIAGGALGFTGALIGWNNAKNARFLEPPIPPPA
jgi:hypothetical protein